MATSASSRSLCFSPTVNSFHQHSAESRSHCRTRIAAPKPLVGRPLGAPKFGGLHGERWGREGCKRAPMMMAAEVSVATVENGDRATQTEEPETKAAVPIEKQENGRYPTVLDINQVKDILPHRYPFLLVDKIIEYEPGKTAVGLKNVTVNDQFFNGHFPQRPIMPGVLQVEALAQVGGIVLLSPEVGGSKENFFFAGVDNVRWRKPVVPGDTLLLRVTLTKLQKRFGIAKLEGKAYVNGEVVCEADLMLMIGK